MKTAVAIGYASIDYPVVLDGCFRPDHTVMIRQRPADAFPRPGGCPIYVARPLVASGCRTSIITWVGADDMAELFRTWAARDGIETAGIATVEGGATPMCLVIYQEDGSCCCCFDPGMLGREQLDAAQRKLIAEADLVCVTVGPPEINAQALELVADNVAVAWVAKNDPLSYPETLRRLLGRRADYVFCNVHERGSIDEALAGRERTDPLIVETNGARPVKAEYRGRTDFLDVPPLSFNDASGAGDTLAGGCLAAIAEGVTDPSDIAAAGIAASSALLRRRSVDD